MSVRVANVLKEELDYEELQDLYWTDSKVVLRFISNESRRFHVYVENRTQFIRDQTSLDQWRYVESEANPADEGSRGVKAKDIIRKTQWIRGSEFLWQTEDNWPRRGSYENEIQESSPEVREVTANTTVIQQYGSILSRFERFSMARVIAARRDHQGQVRSVTVQPATGSVLNRPINKLVPLIESPEDRPGIIYESGT